MNKSFSTELTFNKFVLKHIYINIAVPDDSIKPLLKIKFDWIIFFNLATTLKY